MFSLMARKFKKAMLGLGPHHAGDKLLDVTPSRLRHWKSLFDTFKAKGIKVPMAWGHAPDASDSQPLEMGKTPSGRPRRRVPLPEDCVGYLDAFDIHPDGDKAELTFDIRRDKDIEKVEHNLADVSPVIFQNWSDGDGQRYEDVITHVDLVQHPVDHKQSKFEPIDAIACSLRFFESANEMTKKPIVYRLQTDDEDDRDFEAKDDDSNEETGADETTAMDESERIASVMEALARQNIVLSPDTNPGNFLEHLEQALLTANAIGGGDVNGASNGLQAQAPDVAVMSVEHRALKAHATNRYRDGVRDRLAKLVRSGRATPAERDERLAAINTIQLSLNGQGVHSLTQVEMWISARQDVPAGTFWSDSQRLTMSLNPARQPFEVTGGVLTEDRAKEITKWMFDKNKQSRMQTAAAS